MQRVGLPSYILTFSSGLFSKFYETLLRALLSLLPSSSGMTDVSKELLMPVLFMTFGTGEFMFFSVTEPCEPSIIFGGCIVRTVPAQYVLLWAFKGVVAQNPSKPSKPWVM